MSKAWRMTTQCADCPFATSGAGLQLRETLRTGRWQEILDTLRADQHFLCHKTTTETGNGTNLVCAGALEWQESQGLSSNYQRVCERLEAMFEVITKERKENE